MGTQHDTQPPANWDLPTGRRATSGAPIIEGPNTPQSDHHDTPRNWGLMVNNLWGKMMPRTVCHYATAVNGGAGADTYGVVGRFRWPSEFLGHFSGANSHGIVTRVLYTVSSSDATFQVTTRYGGVASPGGAVSSFIQEDQDSRAATNSGAPAWRTIPATFVHIDAFLDDGPEADGDKEILIEGKSTADGANLDVHAIALRMNTAVDPLDDGPYESGFLPCPVLSPEDSAAADEFLTVEMMNRLALDLADLKSRRTPGFIQTSWYNPGVGHTTPSVGDPQPPNRSGFLAPVVQNEYCNQVRVWIFGGSDVGTAPPDAYWEIRVDRQTIRHDFPLDGSDDAGTVDAGRWWKYDIVLPQVPPGQAPRVSYMDVVFKDARAYGVCAWFRSAPVPGLPGAI